MSQENVEIVRRVVDAIRDRRWEEATRQLGPDIELHGTAGGLTEGSVWRGPKQIRDFFEQDAEAWDERRLEAEQFVDADAGDCVVVLLHEFRRGKGSGVETETDTAMVYAVRDGRVVRIQGHMDRGEALEAAGLRE
jgi:ketosteroid isomerase-like protein